MKHLIFILVPFLLFFAGCSSKKYYEPEKIAGEVDFHGSLPAAIKSSSLSGAVMENGQVITKKGIRDIFLDEEMALIGADDTHVIAASPCGKLQVLGENGQAVLETQLKHQAISGTIEGNLLALVFSDNSLGLFELDSGKELMMQQEGEAFANDAKIAAPFFLKDIVLYPMLNGKVAVVDPKTHEKIRDIVVDSRKMFSNIIFLDVFENRLVAATQNKVISVTPEIINTLNRDVRDVLFVRNGIYVLTRDGEILLCDSDLNVLKKKKFPFAHFIGMIFGKYIYSLEKEGYLIANDAELVVSHVYDLEQKIEDPVFVTQEHIYYDDQYFELNK